MQQVGEARTISWLWCREYVTISLPDAGVTSQAQSNRQRLEFGSTLPLMAFGSKQQTFTG